GKIFFALTLVLDAQQIHDVGLGQDIVDLVRDSDAELFKFARHEGDWPDQRDPRAQFDEAKNVRPGDTAEQNIADNRYVQTGNFSTLLANRVKIEKCLRGVRVRVLGSTKKFTSVFPRSAGTFLISRVPTCLNASAVSRMKLISSADNSRRPSKSLRFQFMVG